MKRKRTVSFTRLWQMCGEETIELPDTVDADDENAVMAYIKNTMICRPRPTGKYVSGSEEVISDSIVITTPAVLSRTDIRYITLLGIDEAEKAGDIIPRINDSWWLHSRSVREDCESYDKRAAYVYWDGSIMKNGWPVDGIKGVRPVLKIDTKMAQYKIGDKLVFGGYRWTMIDRDLALCDEFIRKMPFRRVSYKYDSNIYKVSAIRKFLHKWLAATENMVDENDISEITLLSVEEYKASENNIRPIYGGWSWWLRSPGYNSHTVACFDPEWGINNRVDTDEYMQVVVRPAMRFRQEHTHLKTGDRLPFAGYLWTVIAPNLALCDEHIGKRCFRDDSQAKDANVYEASDIKAFLDEWLADIKHR